MLIEASHQIMSLHPFHKWSRHEYPGTCPIRCRSIIWDRGYSEPDSVLWRPSWYLVSSYPGHLAALSHLSVSQELEYQRGRKIRVEKKPLKLPRPGKNLPSRQDRTPTLPCSIPFLRIPQGRRRPQPVALLELLFPFAFPLKDSQPSTGQAERHITHAVPSLPLAFSPFHGETSSYLKAPVNVQLSGSSVMTTKPPSSGVDASCGHFFRNNRDFIHRPYWSPRRQWPSTCCAPSSHPLPESLPHTGTGISAQPGKKRWRFRQEEQENIELKRED